MIWFFGCWNEAGHFLRDHNRQSVRDFDAKRLRLPRPHDLDGSPLFLPHPECKGIGARTYLPAPDLTILAWWGSPWDTRGAVNNAIIVKGNRTDAYCWEMLRVKIPDLHAKLQMPTITASEHIKERSL